MNVALIACANGLGHIRRDLQLAVALHQLDASVTLFAPPEDVRRLTAQSGNRHSVPEIVDFNSGTSAARLRRGDAIAIRWHERLPSLDAYDVVVSDNLPEILHRRPDALLMGNFLWHEALDDCAPSYVESARQLMAAHKPRMITSSLFAAPYLAAQTDLHRVGLFRAHPAPEKPGDDVLIAIGRGGEADAIGRELVARLVCAPAAGGRRVHVEPDLMPDDAPAWLVPADFTPRMFAQIGAGVCRPGVGILTDLLLSGARPFVFHEPGNREMQDNARGIEARGLGRLCRNAIEAFADAATYLNDVRARTEHARLAARLDDRGAFEAAGFMIVGKSAGNERVD